MYFLYIHCIFIATITIVDTKLTRLACMVHLACTVGIRQTVQSCCGLYDPRGLVLGDLWFVLCGLFGTSKVVIQSAA